MRIGAAPMSARRSALCDDDLSGVVTQLLAHDQRVRGLPLRAHVDGGVVHLTGDVERPAELALARALIGRFGGVHAVWDRVRVAGRNPLVLDLGCGDTRQYPDNIGVDRRRTASVAVQAELAVQPELASGLPFRGGCADRIFVVHVLEHLPDFLPLIDECHRLLRPDGILHVLSPWWKHVNAVADPTHVRLLDTQTIKGICAYAGRPRRWCPLHVSCDGATVFADLTPTEQRVPDAVLARFFD